jgi:hypothetical protein
MHALMRSGRVRFVAVWTLVALLAMMLPAAASAQSAMPQPRLKGLVWGGEVSGTFSRRDTNTFFNYSDYEHDTLRQVRLRLMAELRLPGRVDLLAEVRAENESVDAPAVFLRWQPWADRPFHVQAGRIPMVIGAFARRAYGTDNLLAGAPVVYQYLTSLRPDALPGATDDVLRMRARGWRPSYPIGSDSTAPGLPLIAYSRGDTGVAGQWTADTWTAAAAVTVGTAADPRVGDNNGGVSVSGRLAAVRPSGLTVGISAARGNWVDSDAQALAPPAGVFRHNTQTLAGVDAEFARGHWIVRGEWWHAAFAVPTLAPRLTAHAGFLEGRYRFRPRWQLAARVDRLTFSEIVGASGATAGVPTPWDAPVRRVEGALGFRVNRRLELRAGWQHNWRTTSRTRTRGFPTLQALFWF